MKAALEVIEPKLFAGAIADEIVESVRDCIDERGRCSIVLAGGSTPSAIYRALAKPPRVGEIDWEKVVLYWGDERWVPKTDDKSNFKMVQETLLSHIPEPAPKYFAVDTDLKNPQATAKNYDQVIRAEEKLSAEGLPEFDLVILGVGEDGHTASIFPDSPLLKQRNNAICAAVPFPEGGSDRISLTPEALFGARRILFIVKGEAKADIIKRILEGDEPINQLPARLFWGAEERVTWFLESGTAQKLSRTRS